jgi:hypothetical protein
MHYFFVYVYVFNPLLSYTLNVHFNPLESPIYHLYLYLPTFVYLQLTTITLDTGGDSGLSPEGVKYAQKLAEFVERKINKVCVCVCVLSIYLFNSQYTIKPFFTLYTQHTLYTTISYYNLL